MSKNTKTTTTKNEDIKTTSNVAPVAPAPVEKSATEILHERCVAVLADPKATPAEVLFAKYALQTEGMASTADMIAVADKLNEEAKKTAVLSMISGNVPKWDKVLSGVKYPQIDPTSESMMTEKSVLMRDLFAIKTNSKSYKISLSEQPNALFASLSMFGHNVCESYHASMESACTLKVLCKFTDTPKVFFADESTKYDPTSNNGLEKQLQVLADTIFGAGIQIRKANATHLKAQFTKVTNAGYKNGNEIALLQLVVNHIQDAKSGYYKYGVDSKLSCHKEKKSSK